MAKPNNIGTCSECVYYAEDSEQSGFPKVAALDWCGAYIGPIPDAPELAEYQPMTNP